MEIVQFSRIPHEITMHNLADDSQLAPLMATAASSPGVLAAVMEYCRHFLGYRPVGLTQRIACRFSPIVLGIGCFRVVHAISAYCRHVMIWCQAFNTAVSRRESLPLSGPLSSIEQVQSQTMTAKQGKLKVFKAVLHFSLHGVTHDPPAQSIPFKTHFR